MTDTLKKQRFVRSLLGAVAYLPYAASSMALCAGATAAFAQAATPQAPDAVQADPAVAVGDATPSTAGEGAAADGSDIVVTGSRVASNGFNSAAPLTVLGVADIRRDAPTNIANFVNKLPQVSGSATSQNTSNSVSDGNAGVNNINLRALGASRTLVLLDGVRIVPSSISGFYNNGGSVDINPFPDALIKRVDVVTSGASAVYGSDAIAGVVNFVLDKTFTGLKGEVINGISDYGDNNTYRISLTGGFGFAEDRGHFLLSGTYTHNDGVLSGTSRPWLVNNNYVPITNPNYTATNGQPFILVRNQGGSAQYTPGGLITGGPLRGTDFIGNGGTRMFNYGSPNDGSYMSGGDWLETVTTAGNYLRPSNSLDPALTRKNVFTRLSYDLTDNIEVYGQFIYSGTKSFTVGGSQTANNLTIRSGNPFIPASVQAQMTALGLSSFTMAKEVSSEIGLAQVNSDRKFFQYLAGADGKFDVLGSTWTWDANANRSTSKNLLSIANDLVRPRLALAIDAVRNPATGAIVCASTLTNPTNGCVPFNPMGVGVNSASAIGYITARSFLDQRLAQNEQSATIRGAPFSTWAGPVSLAFGVEHRTLSVHSATSDLDIANAFAVGNFKDTEGRVSSTEGFAEVLVPLAKDMAWAKELSVSGAVRLTDYNTSGTVTTWKAGAAYSPVSDLLFRFTRSRDIRAPNLGELFSAGQSGTSTVRDPFRNNATVPYINIRVGNPNLRPEVANSLSGGAVYRSSLIPGLSASVDYYRIRMTGTINSTDSQSIVDTCFAGNQAFCDLIQRDSAGNIAIVYQRPLNTAFLRTDGLDIEASYSKPLSDFVSSWGGSILLRGLATHTFHLTQVQSNGQIIEGAGVTNGSTLITPSWSYNMTVAYEGDRFSASWSGHGFNSGVQSKAYIECTSGCPASTAVHPTIDNNRAPGQFLMDLNFAYRLAAWHSVDSEFFFHIDNVANSVPSNVPRIGYYPGNYDVLGRSFRAGVRVKM